MKNMTNYFRIDMCIFEIIGLSLRLDYCVYFVVPKPFAEVSILSRKHEHSNMQQFK